MTAFGWWFLLLLRVTTSPVVGADLRPGMQLVYGASNGVEQPPWHIDSVETGLALRPNSDCARTMIRRLGHTTPDETRLCLANDTLYVWVTARSAWQIQRPVGPGMVVVFPRANKDTVRYETGAIAEETISGIRLRVLPTTVTTVDSLSRPKRRLRERYALGLTTAIGGEFASADSTAAGGWRIDQSFALREIRP